MLHTDEDLLEPIIAIGYQPAADKLNLARFVPHGLYNDRGWDFLQPILKKTLEADVRPWRHHYESRHFYRHSFAAWNLSGWEALEAISLAGKTTVTVRRTGIFNLRRTQIVFQSDSRIRATPKVDWVPR